MAAATEGPRDLGFILTELPGTLSRDVVTIASGSGKLDPGTLLAKLAATSKYVPSPATGADGSQTAIAVLAYGVDATSADVDAVVVANDAEVKDPMLVFHSSVDDDTKRNAKLTQLRAVNIKAR
ncbi:hypothetical protein J2857_003611 [Neorhizobium galegae]|uniref:head decoration protein n=1 Tax=Neorhizobium galegae TaxID=399 RepID=UPI001AEA4D5F|nr:head decoration protein [Neorhizobium galegae]MBP2560842.1 hypothetical protein [Neorhizobium galegae]